MSHSDNLDLNTFDQDDYDLSVIKAFIERVEKRLPEYDTGRGADSMLKAYRQVVYSELEAMEKE